ncbi:MAG: ABC transporter permease [Actinobacteria bacterium]|nr:ABC transporter permease [Actinomycetota bacterium]
MSVVRLIVHREYATRVRGKGFIAATLFGLLAIVALNFAPALMDALAGSRQLQLAVVDRSGPAGAPGFFFERLTADLTETLPGGRPAYVLRRVDMTPAEIEQRVAAGDSTAYLVVEREAGQGATATAGYSFRVVSAEALSGTDRGRLAAALTTAATFIRLQERGISAEEARTLFAPVRLESEVVGERPQDESAAAESWNLTYILVILLYMTIVMYGTYIAMGVIEEKSSRVVEVVVASARPFQLMMGKVLGLALVALTQYAVWLGAGFGLLAAREALTGMAVGPLTLRFANVHPGLLVAFLVFFVLGFFTYAGLFAAGGSLVSRSEDAQQITLPLSILIVAAFFLGFYAMDKPDAPLSVALSMVPLLSPIIMFVRVAMGDPAAWQVALSVLLSLGSIGLFVWVAAKVFRVNLLLYGRRVGFSAVVKALR